MNDDKNTNRENDDNDIISNNYDNNASEIATTTLDKIYKINTIS